MDRLTQLRGEAGCSRDSSLDTSGALSEAYITANESSKYFSLSEEDSSFDISPIKDVSLASTLEPEKTITGKDQLISNLSPITKKSDLIDSYKFGKEIEAANILSGGIDIFDDNDNSYDGEELVIDDNAEVDEKSNSELKLIPFQKSEDTAESLDGEPVIGSTDTEVVLQIDGNNVNAIDIGNNLYLYRKAGEEELAAVQIVADDNDQPSFKFLKVRDNDEGNLEVYEEIEVKVPKDMPTKDEKHEKCASQVPVKDVNKDTSDPSTSKLTETKKTHEELSTIPSTSTSEELIKATSSEPKPEAKNGKMIKFNETRKSPVIHSTPNKEGVPLTKTMVDMHLHPSRPLDKVKTIEVHTDNTKQRITETNPKNKDVDENKSESISSNKQAEQPGIKSETVSGNKDENEKIGGVDENKKENDIKIQHEIKIQPIETNEIKETSNDVMLKGKVPMDIEDGKSNNSRTKKDETSNPYDNLSLANEQKIDTPEKKNENSEIVKEVEKVVDSSDVAKSDFLSKSTTPAIAKVDKAKNEPDHSKSEQNTNEKVSCKKDDDTKDNLDKELKPILTEKHLIAPQKANSQEMPEPDEENTQKTIGKAALNQCTENINKKGEDIINKTTTITAELVTLTQNIGQKNKSDVNIKPEIQESTVQQNECKTSDNNVTETKKPSQSNEIATKTTIETKQKEQKPDTSQTETNNDVVSGNKTKTIDPDVVTQSDVVTVNKNPVFEMKQLKPNKSPEILNKQTKPNETIPVNKPAAEKNYKEDTKGQEGLKNPSLVKPELKTKLPTIMPMVPPRRPDAYSRVPISNLDRKPIILNNNAAVPFGQWTPANRQEFLNKIKEAKIPTNASNTKSISKPNDLNRRDVLQKIDSQRQSSSAASKNQELAKLNIKNETPTFTNKPVISNPNMSNLDPKLTVKVETQTVKNKPALLKKVEKSDSNQTYHRPQDKSIATSTDVATTATSALVAKSETPQRNEFNQQDLIDKTVEGIINRAITQKEPLQTQSYKPNESKPTILDDIEMKMNELHGIPFVERPPHELPKVYNREIKTYAKADNTKLSTKRVNKIPNLLPVTKSQSKDVKETIIDLDSEEEVIEHEPITGDIDFYKNNTASKHSSVDTTMAQVGSDTSKKESIITEKDFDKFVRRNSITYENCLTVNVEKNKNVAVQGLLQKDLADKNKDTSEKNISSSSQIPVYQNKHTSTIHITSKIVPVNQDTFNKNYPSKLQMAYQTALTTKRQMESPITILEDKPVKVVFMDSHTDFQTTPLNVQGPGLSPNKKLCVPKELDAVTLSTGDSMDSDILDSMDDLKTQEETKSNKTKHQRKQVLTPADETPELELIVPKDLGIEVSPKKKRKTEDHKAEKSSKNLVPKKSYLLGRNTNSENPGVKDYAKDPPKQINETNNLVGSHNKTASAIDSLVKAAELIENQSGNLKTNKDTPTTDGVPLETPVKRGRGRPRKYPLPEGTTDKSKAPSPQKKPRLFDAKEKAQVSVSDDDSSDENGEKIVRENWTMGKINENIVCPICHKLFRSENVVFKHVKHCTGPSPNRSDSQRLSDDSKSMESKFDDTDGDTDSGTSKQSAPRKPKSKDSSGDGKDDVIVIEDTPVKSQVEKNIGPKQHESRKPTKTKAQYKVSSLSCEYCGKNFRQLSYLVSHKLLHTKVKSKNPGNEIQDNEKTVFSCETCKKEFRKLHHLVQHRIIHNPGGMPKPNRKSSTEQNAESKIAKEGGIKQTEDQSAAFRCEPCDKSFRKLHHLVEHRETHDGINRQKNAPTPQTAEKLIQNPLPPPQCYICKKTFRKLHHLIEHKEQHLETSSEKSDDKSVKSSLSTRDIIHECSLCYMVFPNEHSLNKHSVFCQRKKRQSANKKKEDETVTTETIEVIDVTEIKIPVAPSPKSQNIEEADTKEAIAEVSTEPDTKTVEQIPAIREKRAKSKDEGQPEELSIEPVENKVEKLDNSTVEFVKDLSETPQNLQKVEQIATGERKLSTDVTKKKEPVKTLISTTKRRKSNLPLANIKETKELESSDDDEVRYMFNPDFQDSKDASIKLDVSNSMSKGKLFMNISAERRNSLQFESKNPREPLKRRTSHQLPPKIPRLKTKQTETNANNTKVNPVITKPPKLGSVPCTDSDDSDVKYSFPENKQKPVGTGKSPKEKRKLLADKRKSITDKRKTLSGIARRKSSGTTAPRKQKEKMSPAKEVKRRRTAVEYRCDCGQLFSSAALLARHTSLAHTPPRVRRRRSPPPPLPPPPAPATAANSRKSSTRCDTDNVTQVKPKRGRPSKSPGLNSKGESIPASSGLQSRKSVTQRAVPVPEKFKRLKKK